MLFGFFSDQSTHFDMLMHLLQQNGHGINNFFGWFEIYIKVSIICTGQRNQDDVSATMHVHDAIAEQFGLRVTESG